MEGIKATDIKDFQREVFCITGVISGMSRGDAWAHIEARDGEWTENVTKATTVCVVGGRPGSKMLKAEERGIPLMSEYEFRRLLAMTPLVDESMHLRPLYAPKAIGGYHASGHPLAGTTKSRTDGATEQRTDGVTEQRTDPTMNHEPLTQNHKPHIRWVDIFRHVAAVFIILARGLAVVCGLSVCVCLWLVGIPVKP